MSSSTATCELTTDEGGFPFAVRAPLQPDYSKIPQAKVVDGTLVMPASWDDGDDDDDE